MLRKRARNQATAHVTRLLEILGMDLTAEDTRRTPDRVVRMLEELTASVREPELPFKFTTFAKSTDQLITAAPIVFASVCSHHLLPFFGHVYIGYLPDKRQAGWSKFMRLVHYCAAQPQMQEELTERIATELMTRLQPRAVIVVVTAVHTCSRVRGVRDPEAKMTTSAIRGAAVHDIKDEFFNLLRL